MNKIHTLGGYFHEYQKSIANAEAFWEQQAECLYWKKRWDKVVEWNFEEPRIQWYVNGKLNLTENIFEKNLYTHGNQEAIVWEPNDPKDPAVTLTYAELFVEVCKFANALKSLGVKKGDRVAVYMPMVPAQNTQ